MTPPEIQILPWGVLDTVDNCWLGTNEQGDGPRVYDDESLAMVARDLATTMLDYPEGRLEIARYLERATVVKDEVTFVHSFAEACDTLGLGAPYKENEG